MSVVVEKANFSVESMMEGMEGMELMMEGVENQKLLEVYRMMVGVKNQKLVERTLVEPNSAEKTVSVWWLTVVVAEVLK
ncbi:hypothetical protein PS2_020519 [Malus domestica]